MAITTLNNRSINRSDTASADQVWTATSATASDFQEEALNIVYRNRISEYPPIGDQLDMLWHSIDKNPDLKTQYFDFYEACKAVKVKYPK